MKVARSTRHQVDPVPVSDEANRESATEQRALAQVMQQAHGIDVSQYDLSFLAASAQRRRQTLGDQTPASYLAYIAQDRDEAQALLRSMQIHHSELFRDPLAFALLEHLVLPDLIRKKCRRDRSDLRIWSAGCAAGQEAYSVAILLAEIADQIERPVPHLIFATDRSENQLARAARGEFDAAAMGKVRLAHLHRWFLQRESLYVAAPELKKHIDFSSHDLLDENRNSPAASIFGDFDLILCCNVLYYYRPQAQRHIVNKLRRALALGGYLVTGEVERDLLRGTGGFAAVIPPAPIYCRE